MFLCLLSNTIFTVCLSFKSGKWAKMKSGSINHVNKSVLDLQDILTAVSMYIIIGFAFIITQKQIRTPFQDAIKYPNNWLYYMAYQLSPAMISVACAYLYFAKNKSIRKSAVNVFPMCKQSNNVSDIS